MNFLQILNSGMTGLYADLIDTGGLLETVKLQLFTNVGLSGEIVYGDLVIPTYTGEAAQAIVWDEAVDQFGKPYLSAETLLFEATDSANLPEAIRGAAIVNDAEDEVIAYGYFDEPLTITHAFQPMHVTPKFRLGDRTQPTFEAYVE